MQINISTDYAIRVVVFLAKHVKTVSSSKLSKEIGVSSRYLLQIGAKLRDAGLIIVNYGPSGGYGLAQPAKEISLLDIILIMEERIQTRQQSRHEDTPNTEVFGMIDTAYGYVDSVLSEILKSITIESLIAQSVKQWYLAPYLLNKK